MRYNPVLRARGERAFSLDSTRATLPLPSYTDRELRFRRLAATNPEEAEELRRRAQEAVDSRWRVYEELASGRGC
jgi:pyruvate-ferredoxin/flavodoxin oxidoreductase